MSYSYNQLFKLLIDRGMKKTDLLEVVGSRSTLAKLSKNERVSTEVLERLCVFFNVKLSEIVEFIPN